mmetsp:Transcript_11146/g.15541  ORF Transcript_11146/g.15541 Transcript_11146/m.15541 type:complete len:328 (-) Transcript_11146:199-1182(-)|eukprot:CAMPEP_0184489756 /NCGR_PEP_ID=MMETSP0113_2-20130426/16307_1 /TAXON_ID=91329 /ORGANISM="Norrisiella sphaerica, Strain BC52" /LENGTH=327 /DNA_ID=CAMNT_0026873355 /DNA_START=62 /DNA_END=1045 /DNA_ORIENTATION=+
MEETGTGKRAKADTQSASNSSKAKRKRRRVAREKTGANSKDYDEAKGSGSYAGMLSEYSNKGELGSEEVFEDAKSVEGKVEQLAQYFRESKYTVLYTGAGISTAAGIPDFRGPNGVWTCEARGKKCPQGVAWDDTKPTLTHHAINLLYEKGYVHALVSQNVDGLHLRSGFPRDKLSELHGNFFMEKCERCSKEYLRNFPIKSVGLKPTGRRCTAERTSAGRQVGCRGRLRDTTLDWEDVLPEPDFSRANQHSEKATLSVTLGTSLQIQPANEMPLAGMQAKPDSAKLVIVNLQKTPFDEEASLVIHAKVDEVMKGLLKALGLAEPMA